MAPRFFEPARWWRAIAGARPRTPSGGTASLDELLASRGLTAGKEYEGYSQQVAGQVATLRRLVTERRPTRILEIGFNAGHSADLFLAAAPAAHLLSFDLGCHLAVTVGKGFIDARYPGRHTLIVGDSTATVPAFMALVADVRFDLLFIDGGHTEEVARADLANCARLAAADAIVAVDDTMFTPAWEQPYTVGPTKAWLDAVRSGVVVELGREDYAVGRGMVWGRYR